MKQLDLELLINAARDKIEYHSSVGVGLRMQIQVAEQNEKPVLRAIGAIANKLLQGEGWEGDSISDSELELRTQILLKNLFYKKRIIVEVTVKPWPETAGSHLMINCGSWDYILFDTETCERYLAYLERN